MDKTTEFVTTIQKNQALLYKVAGFYVDNLHDREDLVQEIIYQLWRSYDSFNNKASITTWMYRVAMNTSIWFIKKKRRNVVTQSMDKITLDYPDQDADDIEEKLRTMYQYIKELSHLEKGILMLYLESKSHEEIGSLIGISTSNVGTRIARIKEKLKKQIAKTR